MNESNSRSVVAPATEFAAAAAIAAAAATASPSALIVGGLAVLPALLRSAVDRALRWKEVEAAKFWDLLTRHEEREGVTREEIAGIIEAHQDEPFVRETILRSVRTLLDSVDPCVIVPLAMLARGCLRTRTPPDGFTRNAMRMLTEVGAEELADLRLALRWVLTETRSQEEVTIMATNWRQREDKEWEQIPWEAKVLRDEYVGQQEIPGEPYVRLVGLSDPPRLFHLLRSNGLARETHGVSFAAGPSTVVIDRIVALRIESAIATG